MFQVQCSRNILAEASFSQVSDVTLLDMEMAHFVSSRLLAEQLVQLN